HLVADFQRGRLARRVVDRCGGVGCPAELQAIDPARGVIGRLYLLADFSGSILLRIGALLEPVERIPYIIRFQRIVFAPGEGLNNLAQAPLTVVAHRLVAHPLIDSDILYSPLVVVSHVGVAYIRRDWNINFELIGRSALVIFYPQQPVEWILNITCIFVL